MAARSASPRIVWFRDDLRLSDQPALHAAAKASADSGSPLICLYVLDEESHALRPPQARPLGGATRWWLAQSLRSLQQGLRAVGASLVLRRGHAAKIIRQLAVEIGAQSVFWNEIAQAPYRLQAQDVAASLEEIGVTSHGFPGDLLAHPDRIRSKEGRGLRVFTPFWKRLQALSDPTTPLPAPRALRSLAA